MKFSAEILLTALALPFVEGNSKECVSTFEAGKDYFPDKVEATRSQHWSVTYENSYKIARNSMQNSTYLLYQCGTTPPEDQSGYDAVLSVPITDFGLQSTTYIPFIELLGKRTDIAAFFGSASWVYSPCMSKMFDDNQIASVGQSNNVTLINELGLSLDLPSFVGGGTAFNNDIVISAAGEDNNLAIFEWIKFYSLFFNLEKEANEIYEGTNDRYECAADNAARLSADVQEKPVVLWASYTQWCKDANGKAGGWDVARKCPEYYCEFAETCSAELLTSLNGTFQSDNCGRNYMTTEEFIAFGKDADIWIYTDSNANSIVYSNFTDVLKDFKSVKNGQVYDTLGAGPNSWFEQRLAEPDAILQDFCSIIGYENNAGPAHKLTFLRHIDDEIPTAGICTDASAPLEIMGSACSAIPSSIPSTTTEDTSATVGSAPQVLVLMLSAAVVMM